MFRINTRVLKFQKFAFKPEVCKMGGSFRLQNGLNLLCRIWPSGQRSKDACFGLSLTLSTIFKVYSQFWEMAIFEKIIKIPFLKKCQLF